ncbi:MAG: hypothetical protein K6D91_06025 [Prevotella sp.]|nr:hypothetical protein [Prevotella sp.]
MATFAIQDIISGIDRHLSAIGKRQKDSDGKNAFSYITLSSAEKFDLLYQYIESSGHDIEGICRQLVGEFSINDTNLTISFAKNDNQNSQRMAKSYIVLNSVGEYLAMNSPGLADKYHADARKSMESLVLYVFHKEPPVTADVDPITMMAVNTTPTEPEEDLNDNT